MKVKKELTSSESVVYNLIEAEDEKHIKVQTRYKAFRKVVGQKLELPREDLDKILKSLEKKGKINLSNNGIKLTNKDKKKNRFGGYGRWGRVWCIA